MSSSRSRRWWWWWWCRKLRMVWYYNWNDGIWRKVVRRVWSMAVSVYSHKKRRRIRYIQKAKPKKTGGKWKRSVESWELIWLVGLSNLKNMGRTDWVCQVQTGRGSLRRFCRTLDVGERLSFSFLNIYVERDRTYESLWLRDCVGQSAGYVGGVAVDGKRLSFISPWRGLPSIYLNTSL